MIVIHINSHIFKQFPKQLLAGKEVLKLEAPRMCRMDALVVVLPRSACLSNRQGRRHKRRPQEEVDHQQEIEMVNQKTRSRRSRAAGGLAERRRGPRRRWRRWRR